MGIRKQDIFTPANLVTLLGLALTALGALKLYTLIGLGLVMVGRSLDIADGYIARKTHSSDFGAGLDAVIDKIAGIIILISAYQFNLVPRLYLIFLFSQHITVASMTIFATTRHYTMHVSHIGKQNMFIHNFSLLAFVSGAIFVGFTGTLLTWIGFMAALIGVVTGSMTLWGYMQQVRQQKTLHKAS